MTEYRSLLERARSNFPPPELPLEDVLRGRHRRARNQRMAAGVVGMGIFAAIVVIVSIVGVIDDRTRVPAASEGIVGSASDALEPMPYLYLDCKGTKFPGESLRGRCTLEGRNGIPNDRGRLVATPGLHQRRIFAGEEGTLRIRFIGQGRGWTVTGGTGAYAGLRGSGTDGGIYRPETFWSWMDGDDLSWAP